ncbi:hypothetical protein VNO77_43748 [Canavalia gladiata]|uniref:Uncharacterized protein n=1 Tax=Canavalia gladiata TaxID=3824 RepID=A0AAN9JXB1_CANGL
MCQAGCDGIIKDENGRWIRGAGSPFWIGLKNLAFTWFPCKLAMVVVGYESFNGDSWSWITVETSYVVGLVFVEFHVEVLVS